MDSIMVRRGGAVWADSLVAEATSPEVLVPGVGGEPVYSGAVGWRWGGRSRLAVKVGVGSPTRRESSAWWRHFCSTWASMASRSASFMPLLQQRAAEVGGGVGGLLEALDLVGVAVNTVVVGVGVGREAVVADDA